MNTAIWIVQGVLSAFFLMVGFLKAFTSKEQLEEKMPWTKDVSFVFIKIISVSEILGAIGLILPMALDVIPILTVISASGLAVVMLGAIRTHLKRTEYKEVAINVFLMGLAILIVIVRF